MNARQKATLATIILDTAAFHINRTPKSIIKPDRVILLLNIEHNEEFFWLRFDGGN
jgi:hypothetical protein